MITDDCEPSEKPFRPLPSGWKREVDCHECEGAGRVTHGSPRISYDGVECRECRGTGKRPGRGV